MSSRQIHVELRSPVCFKSARITHVTAAISGGQPLEVGHLKGRWMYPDCFGVCPSSLQRELPEFHGCEVSVSMLRCLQSLFQNCKSASADQADALAGTGEALCDTDANSDHMQAPIVAYVGRLAAQKGMDVLLSALPALFNAPHAASGESFHSCTACASPVSDVRHCRLLRTVRYRSAW